MLPAVNMQCLDGLDDRLLVGVRRACEALLELHLAEGQRRRGLSSGEVDLDV